MFGCFQSNFLRFSCLLLASTAPEQRKNSPCSSTNTPYSKWIDSWEIQVEIIPPFCSKTLGASRPTFCSRDGLKSLGKQWSTCRFVPNFCCLSSSTLHWCSPQPSPLRQKRAVTPGSYFFKWLSLFQQCPSKPTLDVMLVMKPFIVNGMDMSSFWPHRICVCIHLYCSTSHIDVILFLQFQYL